MLGLAAPLATAQDRLPDIGSSAGELLTPHQQREYGQMMLAQLRHYDYVLDDPLIDEWLSSLGGRLGAHSDTPRQSFNFFMLKERQVNAFATLGGYIGVNSGLVLAAEREDEVAGVLAHEIAHVTQQHVLRAVERAQRDQMPILLAMLGAIAAAQAAGGSSAGEATQAVMVTAMGLAQQAQINYTRSNEHEADRVGIRTLSRAGYDPHAMADFFVTMQALSRVNAAGAYEFPDYLRTHPVTTTRISETKARAGQIGTPAPVFAAGPMGGGNPLLPAGLEVVGAAAGGDGTGRFGHARERLRVLTAETPQQAIREYRQMQAAGPLDDAQRYGLALAQLQSSRPGQAVALLGELLEEHPRDLWVELGLATALARSGEHEAADRHFQALSRRAPGNRAVALGWAEALTARNTEADGRRAQALLRPLSAGGASDLAFQRAFARASEVAGDPVRAGEAWAEAAFLGGRAEQALVQLNTLKARPEVDYYARERIEARIARITPVVLELHRQGIRDDVLDRRR
ncbi:M48 family metalloprotease [Lysobacter sp. GX 14042]|uniref:M48 family metalloprotease n=1 Tax=Lysobacter sp. GX 14042 TaxID=2907155 RepID=UPI001F442DBF|nr:M48 family metalloprotease [Lysobacter sp. GX 14042]MCE7032493.1 M48 family metalloprotease [Lysobacter sp. GX 14042]